MAEVKMGFGDGRGAEVHRLWQVELPQLPWEVHATLLLLGK